MHSSAQNSSWRAFPVEDRTLEDIDAIAQNGPQSADEYIALVRHVSRGVPDVMLSAVDPSDASARQTPMPPMSSPEHLLSQHIPAHMDPSKDWDEAVLAHFTWMRELVSYHLATVENGGVVALPVLLPAAPPAPSTHSALLPSTVPAQSSQQLSLPSVEDGKAWRKLCFGPVHAQLLDAAVQAKHSSRKRGREQQDTSDNDVSGLEEGRQLPASSAGATSAAVQTWQPGGGGGTQAGDGEAQVEEYADGAEDCTYYEDGDEEDAAADEVLDSVVSSQLQASASATSVGDGSTQTEQPGLSPCVAVLVNLDSVATQKLLARLTKDLNARLDVLTPSPSSSSCGASSKVATAGMGTALHSTRATVMRGTLAAPAAAAAAALQAKARVEQTVGAPVDPPLSLTVAASTWLYALLARLDTPLHAASTSLVREVLLLALRQRKVLAQWWIRHSASSETCATADVSSTSTAPASSSSSAAAATATGHDDEEQASQLPATSTTGQLEPAQPTQEVHSSAMQDAPWAEDAEAYEAALDAFQADNDEDVHDTEDEEDTEDMAGESPHGGEDDQEQAGEEAGEHGGGCDEEQGYSVYAPLPISAVEAVLPTGVGVGMGIGMGMGMGEGGEDLHRVVAGINALIAVAGRFFGQRLHGEY